MKGNFKFLALAGLLCASCGIGGSSSASATTVPTANTAPATTSTTAAPKDLSPLTGMPFSSPADANRPALAVKIDNAPQAWPQSGLTHADVIYEEVVEGGITRYMAIFQSHGASSVGPVRSVRASDAAIASPLRGLFAYSGGIPAFVNDIRQSGVKDVGANVLGNVYYRLSSRPAPHNLYSSTDAIYKGAANAGIQAPPPPKLFEFRKPDSVFSAVGAQSIASFTIDMSGASHDLWTWDSNSSDWTRTTNGVPQHNPTGVPESATNVIIEFVSYTNTGFTDPAGNPVPQVNSIGSGTAIFLSGGKEATGTWSKPTEGSVTTFSDSSGMPIKLAPGRTWVQFAPIGAYSSGS